MLITLMGKSGSGKTTISSLFVQLDNNIKILDVDKIVHHVYDNQDVKNKVVSSFGNYILNKDETVNRKTLGKIVFNNQSKMQILCDITYSYMEKEIDKFISKNKTVLLDYALIPKTKYFNLSDIKILIKADKNVRGERIKQRDKISLEDFLLRDSNSLDYLDLNFDYIIDNNFDIDNLRKAVLKIYEESIVPRKL